ncbi:hypothetical protein HAX54_012411, partial [Datura stramonium]|nr:hypothetical protein [Datura stramonium]
MSFEYDDIEKGSGNGMRERDQASKERDLVGSYKGQSVCMSLSQRRRGGAPCPRHHL